MNGGRADGMGKMKTAGGGGVGERKDTGVKGPKGGMGW